MPPSWLGTLNFIDMQTHQTLVYLVKRFKSWLHKPSQVGEWGFVLKEPFVLCFKAKKFFFLLAAGLVI